MSLNCTLYRPHNTHVCIYIYIYMYPRILCNLSPRGVEAVYNARSIGNDPIRAIMMKRLLCAFNTPHSYYVNNRVSRHSVEGIIRVHAAFTLELDDRKSARVNGLGKFFILRVFHYLRATRHIASNFNGHPVFILNK